MRLLASLLLLSSSSLFVLACGPDGSLSDDAGVVGDDDGGALPVVTDGGTVADAGPVADAGAAVDGGGASDAGLGFDAGVGFDAGLPDAGPQLVDVIDHIFLIDHFGGDPVDPFDYADDIDGFQAYLDDVGVQYFSANEIVTPNSPTAATQCGYMILLPGRDQWDKIGALALFADQLRALVGEPVFMRNWWRPDCYNELVGGAAGGDHPTADAVDLDFQSASSRALAQGYLCADYWQQDIVGPDEIAPGSNLNPRLNMSIGLGGLTIHLGVLSPGGRRFWTYASYTVEPGSGACW